MASFHFSAQVIGRGKGRSAIAAAAYRSGSRLTDERSGVDYDYRRRKGVVHTEIVVPDGAAPWLADRARLWNHAEAIERRKDAQLAREINMATPAELSADARRDLVLGFVREQFVARGMVADVAIHEPIDGDPRNHHAHVMLTLRRATADGLHRVKTREWNSDALLTAWRESWAAHQNRFLERSGHADRVDHRTLVVQREAARSRGDLVAAATLARQPEIHVGPRAQKIDTGGRTPSSRPREQQLARPRDGRWRSSRRPDKRRRRVDYPVIDRGGRQAFNADRVTRTAAEVQRRVEQTQRRAARLRLAEARQHRLVRESAEGLRDITTARNAPFWRRPSATTLSEREALFIMRRDQARRRAELIRLLLGRVDGLLSGLFMVHERALRRRQSLLDRSLGRDLLARRPRSQGRSRQRPD